MSSYPDIQALRNNTKTVYDLVQATIIHFQALADEIPLPTETVMTEIKPKNFNMKDTRIPTLILELIEKVCMKYDQSERKNRSESLNDIAGMFMNDNIFFEKNLPSKFKNVYDSLSNDDKKSMKILLGFLYQTNDKVENTIVSPTFNEKDYSILVECIKENFSHIEWVHLLLQ